MEKFKLTDKDRGPEMEKEHIWNVGGHNLFGAPNPPIHLNHRELSRDIPTSVPDASVIIVALLVVKQGLERGPQWR